MIAHSFSNMLEETAVQPCRKQNAHANDREPDNKRTGRASLEGAEPQATHRTAHRTEAERLAESSASSGPARQAGNSAEVQTSLQSEGITAGQPYPPEIMGHTEQPLPGVVGRTAQSVTSEVRGSRSGDEPKLIKFPHPVPSESNEVRCAECKCWCSPSSLDRLGLCQSCRREYYS